MLSLHPNQLQSGWWQCLSTKDFFHFSEVNTFRATFSSNIANFTYKDFCFFDDRFFLDVSDTFVIEGHHISRGWPYLGSFLRASVCTPCSTAGCTVMNHFLSGPLEQSLVQTRLRFTRIAAALHFCYKCCS